MIGKHIYNVRVLQQVIIITISNITTVNIQANRVTIMHRETEHKGDKQSIKETNRA